MLRSECRISTSAADRYAKQLCNHAQAMGARASWTPPTGVVEFPEGGFCRLSASSDTLSLVAEGSTPEQLGTIQAIVRADLERFGHRNGLHVIWTGDQALPPPTSGGMHRAHVIGHHRHE